jgi:hypothetical protein
MGKGKKKIRRRGRAKQNGGEEEGRKEGPPDGRARQSLLTPGSPNPVIMIQYKNFLLKEFQPSQYGGEQKEMLSNLRGSV